MILLDDIEEIIVVALPSKMGIITEYYSYDIHPMDLRVLHKV